mmetsp:Transcript_17562/g.35216  ORF Transcript_17562/g.35216 Transcript_17562/m.35216 type:complete len:97 (-) Transcript_17562:145-435(-)
MSSPADRKDNGRDGRLSYSNQAEHYLRKELSEIAKKECIKYSKALGDCAKREGLLVAFKCRGENRSLNECLHAFTNDDNFKAYSKKRAEEIEASKS